MTLLPNGTRYTKFRTGPEMMRAPVVFGEAA
jgi:hypothetical protein